MNDVLSSPVIPSPIATAYEKNGYFFPYDVISETEAAELLADLEAAEAEVAGDRAKLSMVRSFPAHLLPSFARAGTSPAPHRGGLADHRSRSAAMGQRALHQGGELQELRELASGPQLLGSRRGAGGHRLARAHAGECGKRLYALRARQSREESRSPCRLVRAGQPAYARSGDRSRRGRSERRECRCCVPAKLRCIMGTCFMPPAPTGRIRAVSVLLYVT